MTTRIRNADVVEDIDFLASNGVAPENWGKRLGKSDEAIARALYRAKRYDLARPIQRLVSRERDARLSGDKCPMCGRPVRVGKKWCSSACHSRDQAGRKARAINARYTMHKRWHLAREISKPSCDWCVAEERQQRFVLKEAS